MDQVYKVIGVMSGTSLDGLDVALCSFQFEQNRWLYAILRGETYSYSSGWRQKLSEAHKLSGEQLILLHNTYGRFIGEKIVAFLSEYPNGNEVGLIASHGHTLFHRPEIGLTFQLGSGAYIAAITNISTVCDFRSLDLALGGQGAPLVPVGDRLLFPNFDFCLNIGGFANVSYDDSSGVRIAYDICPANILLNHFANEQGQEFDVDGRMGSAGYLHQPLLDELNRLSYYHQSGPRSLGSEWVRDTIMPVIDKFPIPVNDKLHTLYHHIAFQIASIFRVRPFLRILVTGGGARNRFLMSLIRQKSGLNIQLPDANTIDFKEALIFGFLGLLRYTNQENCLCSVTGAGSNSISGVVYEKGITVKTSK